MWAWKPPSESVQIQLWLDTEGVSNEEQGVSLPLKFWAQTLLQSGEHWQDVRFPQWWHTPDEQNYSVLTPKSVHNPTSSPGTSKEMTPPRSVQVSTPKTTSASQPTGGDEAGGDHPEQPFTIPVTVSDHTNLPPAPPMTTCVPRQGSRTTQTTPMEIESLKSRQESRDRYKRGSEDERRSRSHSRNSEKMSVGGHDKPPSPPPSGGGIQRGRSITPRMPIVPTSVIPSAILDGAQSGSLPLSAPLEQVTQSDMLEILDMPMLEDPSSRSRSRSDPQAEDLQAGTTHRSDSARVNSPCSDRKILVSFPSSLN